MPELHITQSTTLQQLREFSASVPDGEQLRAKVGKKEGEFKLYTTKPDDFSLGLKAGQRSEKFANAREAIRGVVSRGAGSASLDGILNGIYWPGTHRKPEVESPLLGRDFKTVLGQATTEIDQQHRDEQVHIQQQQHQALQQVDKTEILQRGFSISGSGSGGVVFANGRHPGDLDVVLKFEPASKLQTTDTMFQALDQVKQMRTGFPFDYGRHEIVQAGGDLGAMQAKLKTEADAIRSDITRWVQQNGVDLKGKELFDERGGIDILASNLIKGQVKSSDARAELNKLNQKLGRVLGMSAELASTKAFSKYVKVEGRPIDQISNQAKADLLKGTRFPQEMGKGGMIGSLLGLNDHCGAGKANMGNFLISDTGKLSIVDITTDIQFSGQDITGRGVPHQTVIDECKSVATLIKDGKLEKTLASIAAEAGQGRADHGGVSRFAEATLGPADGDRLFSQAQGDDHQTVVGGLNQKDKVKLLANYLLGAYEGMRTMVENKGQFKQVIQQHQLGFVSGQNMTTDPDMLLDGVEQAFRSVTPKQLEALQKLAK